MSRFLILAAALCAVAPLPAQPGPYAANTASPVFRKEPPPSISQSEYAERRTNLIGRLQDGVVLALGSPEPEADYLSFFQNSSFDYLTGVHEPSAALVMVKKNGVVTATMFTEAKDPAREVWTGQRLGATGVMTQTGITGRASDALRPYLDSLLSGNTPLFVVGDYSAKHEVQTPDDQMIASLRKNNPALQVTNVVGILNQLRGKKTSTELALLRKSIEITVEAQRKAIAEAIRPGAYEYEAQSLIEYTFRKNGAERPSFSTIVGSGPNSTTLHYNADDRQMQSGETVVMDIGASYRGYAADVTRTVPVNGTYTPAMRDVYQVVRDAQAAAERQATLGAQAKLMSDSANVVLAAGLARLGLIESPTATYDCGNEKTPRECPQFRLYYMHGLGHGIGLEVHDPDQYYVTGKIEPGSAFTIEPGIYVRSNTVDILPRTPRNAAIGAKIGASVRKYANVGVRIEDDYFVTDKGVEWVSRAPREMSEIEALMKGRIAQ